MKFTDLPTIAALALAGAVFPRGGRRSRNRVSVKDRAKRKRKRKMQHEARRLSRMAA